MILMLETSDIQLFMDQQECFSTLCHSYLSVLTFELLGGNPGKL